MSIYIPRVYKTFHKLLTAQGILITSDLVSRDTTDTDTDFLLDVVLLFLLFLYYLG